MNHEEAQSAQWKAFLALCEKKGFIVKRENSRAFRWYAEHYEWNQWTVQLGCVGEFSPSEIRVETYFDHEWNDHRNATRKFAFERREEALSYALARRRALTGDLICEALSTETT
jgi:hypothetical protein